MTVKDLENNLLIMKIIKKKKEELQQLQNNIEGLSSISLKEKVQGGKKENEYITDRLHKIETIKKEILELEYKKFEVLSMIDRNQLERIVLTSKYVLGKDFKNTVKGTGETFKEVSAALKSGKVSFGVACLESIFDESI
jgi:protein-arginine kinase